MSLPRKKLSASTRRQRLPGATQRSAPSLTYYSRRSDQELNTGRHLDREQRKQLAGKLGKFWLRRFGLVILLIAIVLSAFSILNLSTTAKIVELDAVNAGPSLHSEAVYAAAAHSILSSSVWNRNKITVDANKLSSQMTRQFPELASVNMTIPMLSRYPVVYVQLSRPALILVGSSGAYVLDTTGKALAAAANASSLASLQLPVLTDQSGLKLAVEQQALTGSDVSFIQTVVRQLAARHVSLSALTLPPAASELDVRVAGQPYIVKFNLQTGSSDARQQVGTYLATQANLATQNITPSQYIDVRLDGRAYYK